MIIPITPYNVHEYDDQIAEFYRVAGKRTLDKLYQGAEKFLDQPYLWEALGEGIEGKYSQEPLYRTDKFDCVTYLNTVLALSHANNLAEFKSNMLNIRYTNKQIDYTQRTDWFTDLEWLPTARKLNWLHDITSNFQNKNKQPLALQSETVIDKPRWYQVKNLASLRLLDTSQADEILKQLQQEGKAFTPQISTITYIPLTAFFKDEQYLLNQFPQASAVAFIRPNWDIRDNFASPAKSYPEGYGTNLNVSHVGLVLQSAAGPMLYHATIEKQKVVKLSLMEYLEKFRHHESLKGIHIEAINLN